MMSTEHAGKEANPAQTSPRTERERLGAETASRKEPGKEHQMLSKMAGEYKIQGTCTSSPTCGKEERYTFEGESKREMILGGRFLLENICTKMDEGEYHAHAMYGFSNGEFQMTYMDDMSNDIVLSKGKLTAESSSEQPMFEVTSIEPFWDVETDKMKTSRQRFCMKNDGDEIAMDMYDHSEGDESERHCMHIEYSRIK